MIPQFIASAVTIFIILNVILSAMRLSHFPGAQESPLGPRTASAPIASTSPSASCPSRASSSAWAKPWSMASNFSSRDFHASRRGPRNSFAGPGACRRRGHARLGCDFLGRISGLAAHQLAICAVPINIGVDLHLAMGSLGVYGVVVESTLPTTSTPSPGRSPLATAQMLSYEIPMGLGVLIIAILMTGTYARANPPKPWSSSRPCADAMGAWNIFHHQPLLAIIVFTSHPGRVQSPPPSIWPRPSRNSWAANHTEYSSARVGTLLPERVHAHDHQLSPLHTCCSSWAGGTWCPSLASCLLSPRRPRRGNMWGALGLVVAKFVIFVVKVTVLLFVMMWVRLDFAAIPINSCGWPGEAL